MSSTRRLTMIAVTAGLLAGMLAVTTAPAGLGATTCLVRNVTQDTADRSLPRIVRHAARGDRLRVQGTCVGNVLIDVDLTIVSVGADATLAGDGEHRVVRVPRGIAVVFRDLVIEQGRASDGGGIMSRGALRLVRVTIQDNGGSFGGGIVSRGTLTMIDSVVRRNGAWYAGGLSLNETAVLRRTRVVANRAVDQGTGGGISNSGKLRIVDSVIARNQGGHYGAAGGIDNAGELILIDSLVRANFVPGGDDDYRLGSGGGIRNSGRVGLVRSSVRANTALWGGGNWNTGRLTLADSTVIDNAASVRGGGIWTDGTLHLVGSTVTGNRARRDGGGIWNEGAPGGAVRLDASSSVSDNTPNDCVGTSAC